MSLSAGDITELLELWEELNLTSADHTNLSHVETVVCSGAVGHAAFLHVLSVLYVFIFVVGLAANALVVVVALRSDRDEHLYAVNLAAADLCVVATLPVWVASLQRGGRWPLGAGLCKLTHLVFSANLFASIFFLACMSADRYLSATRPAAGKKRAARRLVCVLVWVLALAASAPDTYFLQTVKSWHHDGGAVCRAVYPAENPRAWMAGVQLSFITLGFAVPFPVIAVFYLLLGAAIPPGSDPAADADRGAARRILLAYVVVFVACWLPFHAVLLMDTLALLNFLPFSCRLENFLGVALHLTQALSLVHCCVNPALYGLLSRRYHRVKDAIFRYSTKTGLARLLDSDAECSAGDAEVLRSTS